MEGEREIDSKKKYAGLQQAKKEKKFAPVEQKTKTQIPLLSSILGLVIQNRPFSGGIFIEASMLIDCKRSCTGKRAGRYQTQAST